MAEPRTSTGIVIPTDAGEMSARLFAPEAPGPFPGVIMYHHVGGLTTGLFALAARLSSYGYCCIVPSLYWRIGTVVIDPDNRHEDALAVRGLAAQTVKRPFQVSGDTRGILEFMRLSPHFAPGPRGVIGYCMGGRFATLAAATFPAEIRATSCLFGTSLLDRSEEDVPSLIGEVRGSIYFGMGGVDPRTPPDFREKFEQLLRDKCTAKWVMDVHEGADHGYAFAERPAYQRDAAEASWTRTLEMFRTELLPG